MRKNKRYYLFREFTFRVRCSIIHSNSFIFLCPTTLDSYYSKILPCPKKKKKICLREFQLHDTHSRRIYFLPLSLLLSFCQSEREEGLSSANTPCARALDEEIYIYTREFGRSTSSSLGDASSITHCSYFGRAYNFNLRCGAPMVFSPLSLVALGFLHSSLLLFSPFSFFCPARGLN